MTLSSSPGLAPTLLLAALTLGAAACRPAEARARAEEAASPDGAPAVTVRLAPIDRAGVTRVVRGTGVLRFKSEVDLSFKVGGVVAQVLVDEGARVQKGQLLARLDPTEVSAALRQAEEAVVKAERDLARVERLHQAGAIPVSQRDDAGTAVRLARAARDAAAFNAQRSAVFAPEAGRIDRRAVEPGEIVSPGRPVFHMSGRSRGAVVRIALTDRDVLRLREGDPARVHLDAHPDGDGALAATVAQIATSATPATGTFDVEVRLASLGDRLLSGLTAKVEIDHAEPSLVAVPTAALVDGRGDAASVFVLDDGKAKRVPVHVAFLSGTSAAVRGPLEGHQDVVSAGAATLEDGAPVRVQR